MKLWIPRLLREDAMVEDTVGEFHPLTQYLTLKDHNAALAEKDELFASQLRDLMGRLGQDHQFELSKKDAEIARLKEKVVHYDRWLSAGVYYTNEEFFEKVLGPKEQLHAELDRLKEVDTAYYEVGRLNDKLKADLDLVLVEVVPIAEDLLEYLGYEDDEITPTHAGSCGPETACDGDCMGNYYVGINNQKRRKAREFLGNPLVQSWRARQGKERQ